MPVSHDTQRHGDQVYCRRCGKQWDVKDDPPLCVEDRRTVAAKWIPRLREILE